MTRQVDSVNSKLGRGNEEYRIATLCYTTKEGEGIQDTWHLIDLRRLLQFTSVSAAMNLVYPIIWENGQSRRGFSPEGEKIYKKLQEEKETNEDKGSSVLNIIVTDIAKNNGQIRNPSIKTILVRLLEWRGYLQSGVDTTKRRGKNEVNVRYNAPYATSGSTDMYSQIRYVKKSLTIPVSFLEGLEKLIGHIKAELSSENKGLVDEAYQAFTQFLELRKTIGMNDLPMDDLTYLQSLSDIIDLVITPYKDVNDHPPDEGDDEDNWEE